MEDLLNKWEYNILKNLGIIGTYRTALYRYDKTAFLISTPLSNIIFIKDQLYILFYKAYIVVSKVINS